VIRSAIFSIPMLWCFAHSPVFAQSVSENDWQVAFNRLVVHGQLEVTIPTGRIDILTDEYAIEVDHVRNYRAGIKQALHYAAARDRKAGLALLIDGEGDTAQALEEARRLCLESNVQFWLINEHVSVNDLLAQKGTAATSATPLPLTSDASPGVQAPQKTHWLNTSSDVRHNAGCRWFGNTKSGRYCRANEGRACGTCGG